MIMCCLCYSISAERCDRLFSEVERSAKRIEQLVDKRKEKLKELIRIKALEDEASQVSARGLRCNS